MNKGRHSLDLKAMQCFGKKKKRNDKKNKQTTTTNSLKKKKKRKKNLRFIKENVFYVIYKYIITCKYKDVL